MDDLDMDVVIQMYLEDVTELYNKGNITTDEYNLILAKYGELE